MATKSGSEKVRELPIDKILAKGFPLAVMLERTAKALKNAKVPVRPMTPKEVQGLGFVLSKLTDAVSELQGLMAKAETPKNPK